MPNLSPDVIAYLKSNGAKGGNANTTLQNATRLNNLKRRGRKPACGCKARCRCTTCPACVKRAKRKPPR